MVYIYTAEKAAVGGTLSNSSTISFPKEAKVLEEISTYPSSKKVNTDNFDRAFAKAVYEDGQYNLTHPNCASDVLCQYIDFVA